MIDILWLAEVDFSLTTVGTYVATGRVMRQFTDSNSFGRSSSRWTSKSAVKAQRSGTAAGFGMEMLEARQMLANIVWDGGPAGTGTDFNLAANWVGDVLPAAADTAVINTAGPTITVGASRTVTQVESSRQIQFNGGTFTTTGVSTMTASITMSGGTIAGGTWNFSGAGSAVRGTGSGGTLANVAITGEIILDTTSANVSVSGSTSFTAARLAANAVNLQLVTGYTLNSLVVAEGAAAGARAITMAVGGAGTVTFGPLAIVRLAAGAGGGLNLNNSSAATLVNNGLITAEATGQTLTVNNSTFTNAGTLAVNAGTLRVAPTNWTTSGTVNGTGGTVNLAGILNAASGIGSFNTSAATVVVSGTITNTGNTIQLNATTGSFEMLNGTINGGNINCTAGTALRTTTSGGTLNNVAITGDLLLSTTSANILVSGTTSFTAARLGANAVSLQMAPGYTLNSLVVAEGASTGTRNITMAVGGVGTITVGASGEIRHAAGTGGGLSINNSSAATLINNGLITAGASGQILIINTSLLTNNGTLQVTDGTIRVNSTNWTNTGILNATGGTFQLDGTLNATAGLGTMTTAGGTVNVAGTITNTGNAIQLNAASGSWTMLGGAISGGTMNFADGTFLRTSTGGGTLSSVALNGELLLNVTSAQVTLTGNTTFTAARLSANAVSLQMAAGYTLASLVIAEGAATGTRNISMAVGGAGTVTFAPSAVVRLAAGSGGGLTLGNSSAATLINNGLITAEASGEILLINNTSLTNNGTLRVTAGTIRVNSTNWTNTGILEATGGIFQLDGTLNTAAGIGTMTTAGGTVNVAGTITNTGNAIQLNAASGSWTMASGMIVGGSMNFADGTSLRTSTAGGTLSSVAINGDLLLNVTSATVTLAGNTTFVAARLTANAVNLQMAPGYTLSSLVVVEGAATGTRNISMAVGGVGTVTFTSSAIVRLASGSGGGLSMSNSSAATLINDGLISAEATGRTLLINNSVLTNNGILRVTAGTLRINNSNWTNTGTLNATGGVFQLDGTLNTAAGIGTMTTAAGTVNVAGTITNTGNAILLNAASGSWNMLGGNIVGGILNFADGTALRTTTSGGTLNSVTLNGELLLNVTSASVLLAGTTTFTAARLVANAVNLSMAPGFILNSLVVAEGAATGTRNITMAVGGVGTVTFGPSAIVRLGAGSAAGLNLNNSSAATLINNGVISAEATGETLLLNNTALTNNGTLQVSAGTLRVNSTNWSNPGTLNATGGVLQLDGALNATAGMGTMTTAAGTVNIAGGITNTGNTIQLNATTGSWNMFGGTIANGTLTMIDGTALRTTTTGGSLNGVTVNGEILLNSTSSNLLLTGATTFTVARLTGNAVTLQMAPGFTLNSLVSAEGATTGTRNITLAVGGAGTVTFGPLAIVRLAAGAGGGLNFNNSSVATLVNNGMISAEATGQTLLINNSTLVNNGTIQAIAGSANISNNFTNSGLLSGVTGNLNISGTFDNTAGTQNITAAAGSWRIVGGTILGGTINISGGFLKATNSAGTLNNVAVNGDLTFDITSASLVVTGTTTFAIARLAANGASLQLASGYTLNSIVQAEGAVAGGRSITNAFGGAGTVTYGPSAIVRVLAGSGGSLGINNSSAATVINNGLISSEASGQTISINTTAFTNNGTVRAINGGRVTINIAAWSNSGTLDIQTGELSLGGSGAFTNSGIINVGPGGLVTVGNSGGFTATGTSVVNASIAGTATSQYGRINVTGFDATLNGTLNITFVGAYEPPIVSTFDILTVVPANRSIVGGFTTTVMPPPGVDGKNFMFNDNRHIIFAFSSLADYNSDTVVDFFDYLDFVNDFSNQTGGADFNNDGIIDFFDYLDFLVIFSRF